MPKIALMVQYYFSTPCSIPPSAHLIKVHNCGKFHQCSTCDCQVINFQGFYSDSASMNWPFWVFAGPYSHRNGRVMPNFSQVVVFMQIKSVFSKSFKNLHFPWNRTHPKFTLLVQFLTQFIPENQQKLLKATILQKLHSQEYQKTLTQDYKVWRFLVKLNKKSLRKKIGANYPWAESNSLSKALIDYNIHIFW